MAIMRPLQKHPQPARPLRVLFLEDNPSDVELAQHALEAAGFEIEADVVASEPEFLEKIDSVAYDFILADYNLRGWNGMDALEMLRKSGRDTSFILLTGSLGEEAAVDCINQGATDYVLKDRLARLPVAVRRALDARALEEKENH